MISNSSLPSKLFITCHNDKIGISTASTSYAEVMYFESRRQDLCFLSKHRCTLSFSPWTAVRNPVSRPSHKGVGTCPNDKSQARVGCCTDCGSPTASCQTWIKRWAFLKLRIAISHHPETSGA